MKKVLLPLLTTIFLSGAVVSCMKITDTDKEASAATLTGEGIKTYLVATTWQIDEVKDPFSGVRFKRGSISDGKAFDKAYYTYRQDGKLTGLDWSEMPINATYEVLEGSGKIKVSYSNCILLLEVLSISDKGFVYKSNDGSIFTLVPVVQANKIF